MLQVLGQIDRDPPMEVQKVMYFEVRIKIYIGATAWPLFSASGSDWK
jgi:hypothetical protein